MFVTGLEPLALNALYASNLAGTHGISSFLSFSNLLFNSSYISSEQKLTVFFFIPPVVPSILLNFLPFINIPFFLHALSKSLFLLNTIET